MKFQHFCYVTLATTGLMAIAVQVPPAFAERFSFGFNGLGITESPNGDRTLSGSLSIEGDQMLAPKVLEFDLTHGDRGDGQSLEMGVRDQGESVLNTVLDLFGLTSNRGEIDDFDAQVSGDINPTDSEINMSLGQDLPGLRLKIQTPQGNL